MSADEESAQGPDIAPEIVEEVSESTPEESTEGQTDGDAAEETAESEEAPKKHKGGFQKRISELTQRRRELEAANAELRAQLEKASAPKEEAAPKRDDFDSFDDWTAAVARHEGRLAYREEKARAEQAERDRAEKAAQAAAAAEWEARNEAAFEKYDDYGEMFDAVGTSITPDIAVAIREAENGPDIVMHLGKHPDVLKRVCKLSGLRAAIEIGKLEERIAAEAKARKSQAPKPIARSKTTGAASPNGLSDDLPIEEWLRRRNKLRYG